jgi:exodeoxyribonuclease III
VFTIATWNVNSIRMRYERLVSWLERGRPDVVCLQEIKVPDADFPRAELEALGWHVAVFGQKAYNGVALLSRRPLLDVTTGFGDQPDDADARVIAARVDGVRIASVYVPNGKVVGCDKWVIKLAWFERLRAWLVRTATPDEPLALCGDFNVAPEDRDVARPDEWQGSVLCHEDARAALRSLMDWGLVDTIRLHHHGDGPYSWWDYRMLGFAKGNGLRIDHILATRPLAARCTEAFVVREERKGKQPSDHAPVVAVFGDQEKAEQAGGRNLQ